MMVDERRNDALTEVINIGFSRAAASLSDLTGKRVLLDVPRVGLYPISELHQALSTIAVGDVATVHQIFSGPVAGDAFLMLGSDGASVLVNLLTRGEAEEGPLDGSHREVLVEVGNILLNACLGSFGNLLQVRITFAVPRLQLDSLDALLDSLVIGSEELRYALVAFTNFRLYDASVSGYLVIVLSVASLDRLLQEVSKLG